MAPPAGGPPRLLTHSLLTHVQARTDFRREVAS
jgi:hypothetical protein